MKIIFLFIVILLICSSSAGLHFQDPININFKNNHAELNNNTFSLSAQNLTETFTNRYNIEEGNKINVYNIKGSIKFIGWDRDYVEVTAFKRANHHKCELDNVDIQVNYRDGLTIETINHANRSKVTVNYIIRIPRFIYIGEVLTKGKIRWKNISESMKKNSSYLVKR
ncbi:MAG: hypothetical protein KAT74_03615 [Candidatus Cloacimonetes bacterium]|nr:hypothetical protein [Candidatus Cloacimonadota bacterium]